jgi:hypothetical protein
MLQNKLVQLFQVFAQAYFFCLIIILNIFNLAKKTIGLLTFSEFKG